MVQTIRRATHHSAVRARRAQERVSRWGVGAAARASAAAGAAGARARALRERAHTGGREAGLATAEYAIVTVAAAGFAGLLIVILRSPEVRESLLDIVRSALSVG